MIERMVLLGASGDLTSRLLLPAIAQLAQAGLLPPGFTIVGASNAEWTTEDFRQHIAAGLEQHSTASPSTREAVIQMLTFQPADVTQAEDISRLLGDDRPDTLVYLALPPSLFEPVLTALAGTSCGARTRWPSRSPLATTGVSPALTRSCTSGCRSRRSSVSITSCPASLSAGWSPSGFLNRVFEPIWNATHIESVDISWLESLTLEGRATYYDGAGAMKDMVQNHLMEAMALVLMEQPARIDARSFRDVRVERSAQWPRRRRK